MTAHMTVDDLPVARNPGDPGIHSDKYGTIYIPLGLNVYNFPQFVKRRYFEMDRKAGGMIEHDSLRTVLARCSHCRICIGRGYFESELYLYPVLKRTKEGAEFKSKILCGGCATDPLEMQSVAKILVGAKPSAHDDAAILPLGFCLIHHDDWAGPRQELIKGHWNDVVDRKMEEVYDELIDDFNDFLTRCLRQHRRTYGNLVGFAPRRLFAEWILTQQPTVRTFTHLYAPSIGKRAA